MGERLRSNSSYNLPLMNGEYMKILHFKPTMRLEEGGVVKAVLDLCSLVQTDNSVGLATFDATGVPAQWLEPNDHTTQVHKLDGDISSNTRLNKEQREQIRKIIREYDVVHLHSMWSVPNPQVASICKGEGIPYILSVHGMLDDWCIAQRKLKKMIYMKTWGRNLLRDASMIHCTAQAELDQASAWFVKEKGIVVPLPFDLEEYKILPGEELAITEFEGLDHHLPKVLFLSRVHYKKGVDRLIQASSLLHKQGVRHQLVIAGTGEESYMEKMKQLADTEGVSDSTYFLGFASGQAKVSLFQVCQVFALPTSQENFGFVFFESLAAGLPVLTTKGTDTWPEIEQSQGGVIAENTPEDFAKSLKNILSNIDHYHERGQSAREWVFGRMSADHMRKGYNEMYDRCRVVNQNH